MAKKTTNVTIYHFEDNKYLRSVYDHCFWEEDQAANIKKSGLTSIDSLYVSIPLSEAQTLVIKKGKDLIINGDVNFEFDNTSQATQSSSLNNLRANHDVFTINSYSKKDHGSPRMRHWELSGK
jgi:hypothetical protein